jgi:hypothetical protein
MIDKTVCEVLWRNISDFYVILKKKKPIRKYGKFKWIFLEDSICYTCYCFKNIQHHFFKCLYQVRVITVFTVVRLLTDFVCLYNYEFGLSLCKIVRSSVILLLPLVFLNNIIKKNLVKRAHLGHCNRAAVSRNRYGVEQTVDTHKILINETKLTYILIMLYFTI